MLFSLALLASEMSHPVRHSSLVTGMYSDLFSKVFSSITLATIFLPSNYFSLWCWKLSQYILNPLKRKKTFWNSPKGFKIDIFKSYRYRRSKNWAINYQTPRFLEREREKDFLEMLSDRISKITHKLTNIIFAKMNTKT